MTMTEDSPGEVHPWAGNAPYVEPGHPMTVLRTETATFFKQLACLTVRQRVFLVICSVATLALSIVAMTYFSAWWFLPLAVYAGTLVGIGTRRWFVRRRDLKWYEAAKQ